VTLVFALLTFQCLLGAFDNLWHHEWEAALPQEPGARKELALHTAREFLYAIVFVSIAWTEWHGGWAVLLIAILLCEIAITIADFLVEDRTRRLPPLERALHTVLALSYGATLAVWAPTLLDWLQATTAWVRVDHGIWSWLMTLFSAGVFLWSLRDLYAVARLGVPQWQRNPLRAGPSDRPRFVLVTGATGFIGQALTRHLLARGDHVIVLSRYPERARDRFGPLVEVCGDLAEIAADRHIDAIVNLAGAPVVGPPWTAARRRVLLGSRVAVTRQVQALIQRLQRRPEVLVNGSAIGFYGERGDARLDEASGPGTGFLSELCRTWEAEATLAQAYGVRVCLLRIGLVLGRGGGVLQPLALASRFGLGAVFGSGRQGYSWIHLDDLIAMIDHAIDQPDLHGAVNATAPSPICQREAADGLAAVLRRPRLLGVPAFVLRMAIGEMSDLFLASQHVVPQRMLDAGFQFRYAEYREAIRNIVCTPTRQPVTRVFVNTACPVCRSEMNHYRDVAEAQHCAIDFCAVDAQQFPLARYALTAAHLRKRLYVIRADGELRSGVDALIAIWQTLDGYRLLARIVALPGVHRSSEMLYDLVVAPLLTWWSARREPSTRARLPATTAPARDSERKVWRQNP